MQLFFKSLRYLSLIMWAFIILYPFCIILFGSFMTHDEFSDLGINLFPNSFLYLKNYILAFQEGDLARGFIVTFIIILLSVVGSIFLGSAVSFFISRTTSKKKNFLLFFFFLVSSVPMVVTQVGTFKIMVYLHLYNTIWAPILLYIGADVTMIYLYLQNLEQLPKELDQAAIIDGANYFQVYWHVILPLLRPATITVIVLKMISIYNDFYIPYLYMPSAKLSTVSTAIFRFVGPYQTRWEVICACIIISMIPMCVIYIVLQKKIEAGLMQGSVKE